MLINPISLFFLLGVGLALLLIISLVLKRGDQSPSKKLLIALLAGISVLLLQEALIISKPPRWLYYIFGAIVTSWYFVPPLSRPTYVDLLLSCVFVSLLPESFLGKLMF